MISLRREDAASSALTIIAIVTLTVSLLVMLFVPKPSTTGLRIEQKKKEGQIRIATDVANDRLKVIEAQVNQSVWTVPEQQVGPTALARVSALVRARGLKLIAFRPQRKVEEGQFVHLPYLLTIEGAYPAVAALTRDLQAPTNRLAVSLVQIASSDASTDEVSASIGLVAYLPLPKQEGAPTRG